MAAEARRASEDRRRVEIVHESLLTNWPRLVGWQTQDADGARVRDELRQAARLWEEHGRTDDRLWTGSALREYQLWRERYPGGLTEVEEAFASATTRLAHRRKHRRRLVATAVIGTLALGLLSVGILWRRSEVSRQLAGKEVLRAESSRLVALGELRLKDDPTEALAFAIASLEKADSLEARHFVLRALGEAPPARELVAGSQAGRFPRFSPSGSWLATAGHTSESLVWSRDGGGPLVLPDHEFSPRGSNVVHWVSDELLVTGGGPAAFGTKVQLWSLPAGSRVRTIDFGGPSAWKVMAGHLFAETIESGTAKEPRVVLLRRWALPGGEAETLGRVELGRIGASRTDFAPDGGSWLFAKGRELHALTLPITVGSDRLLGRLAADITDWKIQQRPDRLAVVDGTGGIAVWSFSADGPVREAPIVAPASASDALRLVESGRWLIGDPRAEGQVRLWDRSAWRGARPLVLQRNATFYGSMAGLAPEGDWVVASTHVMTRLTLWPVRSNRPLVVDGYGQTITRPVAFSPDGRWLATSWRSDRLRLWPLFEDDTREPRELKIPQALTATALAFDSATSYLFAVGHNGGAWILPLDGSTPRAFPGYSVEAMLHAAAVSPSGGRVATAFGFGPGEKVLRALDRASGELRELELPLGDNAPAPAGESASGHEGGIRRMAFAGESVLYTLGDGGLRRWDLATGAQQLVAPAATGSFFNGAFDADGRLALAWEVPRRSLTGCREPRLHDLARGTSRLVYELGDCASWTAAALDRTGSVVAIGTVEGTVLVGRLGEAPHRLHGHRGAITGIAIAPDLRWLATSGEDSTLRLWPMPDLSKPPLHTLPYDDLLAKLKSLTNLRVVEDAASPTGYKLDVGPFPGWETVPEW